MELWYFEADPETGVVKAGYTVNGKRYVSLVWSQYNRRYVSTGERRARNREAHQFSPAQDAAYKDFMNSDAWSVEFKEAIQ